MATVKKRNPSVIELAVLLLILALAAYLRLANVGQTPGWYSDEGTLINIATNFMHGKIRYLAITQSILVSARQPLFPIILAGLFQIWGEAIEVMRVLTGGLGVLSVGILYWVVRRIQGGEGGSFALLSALMLAIYPQAILYSRLGFSYNLLTPLVLLTYWGLWEYLNTTRPGWLILAALTIGLGAVSDLMILTLVAPVALVVSSRRWQDLLWSLPLVALPFSLYVAFMLIKAPQAFLFDLGFTVSRIGGIPWLAQLPLALLNYTDLLAWDYWLAPAIIGLFLLHPLRWRRLSLLLFLAPLFILGRTIALIGLGFYYLIPLLPFVALGMAALVRYGAPHLLQLVQEGLAALFQHWAWTPTHSVGQWWQKRLVVFTSSIVMFIIIVSPFLISVFSTVMQTQNGFETAIDNTLVNPGDARQVADFINTHTADQDLVIASPAAAWLFQANVADFQQAIAAEGQATVHLPGDIPADRFVFDPRYTQARFVVIDNIWRNWAAPNIPEVAEMMEDVAQWPRALKVGEFEIYRNPTQ